MVTRFPATAPCWLDCTIYVHYKYKTYDYCRSAVAYCLTAGLDVQTTTYLHNMLAGVEINADLRLTLEQSPQASAPPRFSQNPYGSKYTSNRVLVWGLQPFLTIWVLGRKVTRPQTFALGAQVPNNHILPQNLYQNY